VEYQRMNDIKHDSDRILSEFLIELVGKIKIFVKNSNSMGFNTHLQKGFITTKRNKSLSNFTEEEISNLLSENARLKEKNEKLEDSTKIFMQKMKKTMYSNVSS